MEVDNLKFRPVGNFILIKPLSIKYDVQKQTVLDDDKNDGKDPMVDEMETKVVETKVKKSQQLAKVLSIGTLNPDLTAFKVGDTIVYPINATVEFELMKGCKLIYAHNVLGIWQ